MDLCLMIEGQNGVTWEQWVALARACEAHGIGTLFRSDHYLELSGAHPELGSLDAWGTLCALAAVTSTLRLGTMVSPATFRHPSNLAKLVVTADQISGGRVELGLGAGWHEREHAAYGFPYNDLRTRMDVFAEQLEVIHGTWTEPSFSFRGEHYTLDQLRAEPRPVQTPHPPLIMGGNAGPRVARLAARFADEYNTVMADPTEVSERKARVDAACAEIGRDPLPFSLMTTVIVGSDEQDLRARAARVGEVTGMDGDALVADPPASMIVGTVEFAAEQLRAFAEVGVSRVMCQHLAHEDVEFVAVLGDELAPLVA
jgi:F420-dependent oxidoreductase-like protein